MFVSSMASIFLEPAKKNGTPSLPTRRSKKSFNECAPPPWFGAREPVHGITIGWKTTKHSYIFSHHEASCSWPFAGNMDRRVNSFLAAG